MENKDINENSPRIEKNNLQQSDTDIQNELVAICEDLDIEDDIQGSAKTNLHAISVFQKDLQLGNEEALACALYIALIDARMPYGPYDPQLQCGMLSQPTVTITEILRSTNCSVTKLTKTVEKFKETITLSEAVVSHLKDFEKKYCIVSAIYHSFKRLCGRLFGSENEAGQEQDRVSNEKEMCWTLFILAKNKLLTDQQIIDAFYILVCCVEYVVSSNTSVFLNEPFSTIKKRENQSESTNKILLEALCNEFNLPFEEVNDVYCRRVHPFVRLLPHDGKELNLEGLIDMYSQIHKSEGDIDELSFLTNDPLLQSLSQENGNSSPPNHHAAPLTPLSRLLNDMKSLTVREVDYLQPMLRAAMNSVQQLKHILSAASELPSKTLKEFFQQCSAGNPEQEIIERVASMKSVFVNHFIGLTSDNQDRVAEQRFELAQKLYYRVLETMLLTEKERLTKTDFSTLLKVEALHKSLLACSIEIVLMTYGVSWDPSTREMAAGGSLFAFPWILDVFDMKAYDFFKVLESFIKAEPVLSKDIITHLKSLEIKILESLAWKSGSPVFNLLPASTEPADSSPVGSTKNSNTSSADLYLSPMRPPRRKGSPSVVPHSPRKSPQYYSPAKSLSSPEKKAQQSRSFALFLDKVRRLGHQRLLQLCNMLEVQKELVSKVWMCFDFCITNKAELLKGRHLDQTMMSSLYAVCKIVDREIKFKTIVSAYRELPYAQPKICKETLIDGERYDSIIVFYNRVFMPNLKNYIMRTFGNNQNLNPTQSPGGRHTPYSPVYSVSNRRNFYVSPMKDSPFKPPPSPSQLTPRSRQLYSFGEGFGSSEKLKQINESMNKAKTPTSSRKKRLRFDQPEGLGTVQMSLDEVAEKKVKVDAQEQ